MATLDNIGRARRLLSAMIEGDVEGMGTYLAPDALICMPFSPERRTGLAGVIDGIKDIASAGLLWGDVQLVASTALDADRTATNYTSRYSRTDNHETVTTAAVVIHTWKADNAVEVHFYEDFELLRDFVGYDRVQLTRDMAVAVSKPNFGALGEFYSPKTVSLPIGVPWGGSENSMGFEGIMASFRIMNDYGIVTEDFSANEVAPLGERRTLMDATYTLVDVRGATLRVHLITVLHWRGPRMSVVESYLDTEAINQFIANSKVDYLRLHHTVRAALAANDLDTVSGFLTSRTILAAIAVPWGAERTGPNAVADRLEQLAKFTAWNQVEVHDVVAIPGTRKTVDYLTSRFSRRDGTFVDVRMTTICHWEGRSLARIEEYYDTSMVARFLGVEKL